MAGFTKFIRWPHNVLAFFSASEDEGYGTDAAVRYNCCRTFKNAASLLCEIKILIASDLTNMDGSDSIRMRAESIFSDGSFFPARIKKMRSSDSELLIRLTIA
mgnify:CR=1 FL=1